MLSTYFFDFGRIFRRICGMTLHCLSYVNICFNDFIGCVGGGAQVPISSRPQTEVGAGVV